MAALNAVHTPRRPLHLTTEPISPFWERVFSPARLNPGLSLPQVAGHAVRGSRGPKGVVGKSVWVPRHREPPLPLLASYALASE